MFNKRNVKKVRGFRPFTNTLYERIRMSIDNSYPFIDDVGRKRMTNQYFAKALVKGKTIGRDSNGKLHKI